MNFILCAKLTLSAKVSFCAYQLLAKKKEKCERSQLWSMYWCGERPFGHRASNHTSYNNNFCVV